LRRSVDRVVARRSQPITRRSRPITRYRLIRPDFPGLAATLGRHMWSTHPLEDALQRLRTRTDRCWRRGCAAGRASFFVWLRFSDLSYTPGVVGEWERCVDVSWNARDTTPFAPQRRHSRLTSASPVRAKTPLDDELGSLGPGRPVDRERKDCRSPERLANRRPRKTFRLRKAETDRLGKTVVELRKTRWLCTWNGEAKAEFFWLCFSPGIFCLLFMSCIFPSAIDVALVFQMNWEILFLSFWGKARRTSSRTE
jgi:hypothetical protein